MRRVFGRLGGIVAYAFGYFVILELMLAAAVLYWPEFFENLDSVRSLAAPIPMLGDLLDTMEESGVFGYIAGQHFFKGCNTLGSAAAVLFAVGAVAGEVHRGTLEILLARPQSRARVLGERYLAGLLALAIPILVSSASIPYLADRVDEYVAYESVLLGAVHQIVFLATIYSATFFLSTIGSNPTKIALVVLFTTTFCFALYMIKYVSRFSLYRLSDIPDYVRIDDERSLDWGTLGPLLLVSALLYAASLACFKRRVP